MTDDTVLGFKNGETAMVLLWLENERPLYERAVALTREVRRTTDIAENQAHRIGRPNEYAPEAIRLADAFEELIEAEPELASVRLASNLGHAADLIAAALGRVDWRELGAHFLAVIDR